MDRAEFGLGLLLVALSGGWAGCFESSESIPSRAARRPREEIGTSDLAAARPRHPDASTRAAPDAGYPADRSNDSGEPAESSAAGSGNDPTRWILAGDLTNARDLGGTPLPAGASVAYGALFRGPPLAPLSAAGCAEFAQLGIRTVIDLRIASERAASPESKCVNDTAQVALAPLPIPYNVSPSDYLADLNATDSLRAAFQYLGDESAYPIYLHCTWGRDRTGVLAAVILSLLGAGRAAIQREYQLSTPTVGAYPRSLEAVLDEIERRGGIDSFLDLARIPADQRSALRNSATER